MRRWQFLLPLAVWVLAIFACAKAPEYVVRGWTPTPTKTPLAIGTPQPTVIVVYATEAWYTAEVLANGLEIRNGPGTKYPSNPVIFLSRGDKIMIMACKYDEAGEAWINFYWSKQNVYGWSAVTWRGTIFIWPMPRSCR